MVCHFHNGKYQPVPYTRNDTSKNATTLDSFKVSTDLGHQLAPRGEGTAREPWPHVRVLLCDATKAIVVDCYGDGE